jgi:hypothetical protein
MKIKYFIFIFLIIIVVSSTGCIKKIITEIESSKNTQIVQTTTTILETSVTVTETTISDDQTMENIKTALIKSLNSSFGVELTEFSWGENNTKIVLAYISKNTAAATIKKEMYDIAKSLTDNGWIFNADLELDASTSSGENFQSITKLEDMMKLENLELSYEDWLKVAIK